MNLPYRTPQSYSVGIICALAIEKAAIEALLDEEHPSLPKVLGDENEYTFGKIGYHNVIVACLPAGLTGKASAAVVAKDMSRSFQLGVRLMVGIGGGVWSESTDIRLGDVVVSQPDWVAWRYSTMGLWEDGARWRFQTDRLVEQAAARSSQCITESQEQTHEKKQRITRSSVDNQGQRTFYGGNVFLSGHRQRPTVRGIVPTQYRPDVRSMRSCQTGQKSPPFQQKS